MLIETETTPNPNAIKFSLAANNIIISQKPVHFSNIAETRKTSKLAELLFLIKGVEAVFFSDNFITITKDSNTEWSLLKLEIIITIQSHIDNKLPIVNENSTSKRPQSDLTEIERQTDLTEIEKQIIELIETKVKPAVARDGGYIEFVSFKDGIVQLKLTGACAGCPSSSVTLKNGIESMLRHYVPEVQGVEAVSGE